jgi:alkylation response protein AidB-like acyl-CoA dehydrogenase
MPWAMAGRVMLTGRVFVSHTSEMAQIYEGTNQIQRVVMARQLLK